LAVEWKKLFLDIAYDFPVIVMTWCGCPKKSTFRLLKLFVIEISKKFGDISISIASALSTMEEFELKVKWRRFFSAYSSMLGRQYRLPCNMYFYYKIVFFKKSFFHKQPEIFGSFIKNQQFS
jgi:hypothetical protein